jgi:hypothetical protein
MSEELDSAPGEISLDLIMEKQLQALYRVTKQLARSSILGMTKDEIQSLATCMRVTMDLKAKEKELLDNLSDEDLEKVVGKKKDD